MSITQPMNTQRLGLGADYRFYAWERSPDWSQGVVFQWRPAVAADASIIPLSAPEDPLYIEIIEGPDGERMGDAATDNPFDHLRVRETGTGGEFWVMSDGLLREVDSDGDPV